MKFDFRNPRTGQRAVVEATNYDDAEAEARRRLGYPLAWHGVLDAPRRPGGFWQTVAKILSGELCL